MAIKLPPLPAPNERLVVQDGMINPVWYQWLKGLETRLREAGIATLANFDEQHLTNGQTLRWDVAQQRFMPGD